MWLTQPKLLETAELDLVTDVLKPYVELVCLADEHDYEGLLH